MSELFIDPGNETSFILHLAKIMLQLAEFCTRPEEKRTKQGTQINVQVSLVFPLKSLEKSTNIIRKGPKSLSAELSLPDIHHISAFSASLQRGF